MEWAIIGHGSSPTGRGWGRYIDACGKVVRMWNWHWQNLLDYGEAYHVGFYELHPTEMARFHRYNQRTPQHHWLGVRSHHKPYFEAPLSPTVEIDPHPWVSLGISLGGMGTKGRLVLTRGSTAAAWAVEQAKPGDRVILVGFDNTKAGVALTKVDGFPNAYVESAGIFPFRNYKGGERRYSNHDYGVERPLLETLAERGNVELSFAEDIW